MPLLDAVVRVATMPAPRQGGYAVRLADRLSDPHGPMRLVSALCAVLSTRLPGGRRRTAIEA